MAQPGDMYTFTTLFLDGLNQPIDVDDPIIEVFVFNDEGVKTFLVPSDTPMVPVEGEVGRFSHTLQIPLNYEYSSTVFAIMQGVSPGDGFTILVEDQLEVFSGNSSGGGGNDRMIARFVKGG